MVAAARYLTLLWPGMAWLWLRGSAAGLVLALAFAVVLDLAIVATWVYSDFFGLQVSLGLWAAAAAVWIIATVSAVSAFPPPISTTRDAATDALFVAARDAYLSRDWLATETKLRSLLVVAPTDGEAQLLLATLLRRVGRLKESREALDKLSRSDSGGPWLAAVARELELLAAAAKRPPAPATTATADDDETAILPLDRGSPADGLGERAA
jgi:hypothetical protein